MAALVRRGFSWRFGRYQYVGSACHHRIQERRREDFLFVGRGVSDANMSDGLPCKAGMFHAERRVSQIAYLLSTVSSVFDGSCVLHIVCSIYSLICVDRNAIGVAVPADIYRSVHG